MFKECIKNWIVLTQQWLSDPEDYNQLEEWYDAAGRLAEAYDFTEKEQHYVDHILDCYYEQYRLKINKTLVSMSEDVPTTEQLDALLQAKQTEQRTPEWYKQMSEIISASELGNLFGSARERAKMVVSKTVPYQSRSNYLAVPSTSMTPFDWGIRFEPVVKQIYEYRYGVEIRELGRLHHPTDPRCTASPDGLIYSCSQNSKKGQLIEIKCPVTREIDGTIPKDYYAQMQMQLQVTGLKKCNYVEAVFSSPYKSGEARIGAGLYNGYVALIRYEEPRQGQIFGYQYSPINAPKEWKPIVDENAEEIAEIIPWSLYAWHEQVVTRNEDWWQGMIPVFDQFWKDVEAAKRGEFVVPESTRPSKKAKVSTESCMIQFRKLDENGQEIPNDEPAL